MKIHALLITLLTTLLLSSPASAQVRNGEISDILGEIFKTQRQHPQPDSQHGSRIDNIPVDVHFEAGQNGLPENAMLIITAYAPPPPNVRRSAPLMLGQTRILVGTLRAPLNLIIAAPAAMTSGLDYARIEAEIVDTNGNAVFELKNSGEYRGRDAAQLALTRVGSANAPQPHTPSNLSYESVKGLITLNGAPPNYRGSNLTVRLIEDGLAGGISRFIAGEHRQAIDQKTAPFSFSLDRVIDKTRANTPLAFEVWIEDWAGRKTHVTPRPIAFNGAGKHYNIALDTISVGTQAQPQQPPAPVITSQRTIQGKAKFDAYKGLPSGSVLTAELVRLYASGTPTRIAQTRLVLDGLSGDIDFNITAPETAFDPRMPAPILRITIKDKDGKTFFTSPEHTPLKQGINSVYLQASAQY